MSLTQDDISQFERVFLCIIGGGGLGAALIGKGYIDFNRRRGLSLALIAVGIVVDIYATTAALCGWTLGIG